MSSCCAGKKQEASAPSYFLEKLKLYRPLIIILALSVISAFAVHITSTNSFMNLLMGFFLLFLSALKLFNIEGFVTTFKRYDVLVKHIPFYGTAYPFIELVLSLLFLSGLFPLVTNSMMLFFMLAGCIGIVNAIRARQTIQCACVGNIFNLPVGKVTLAENLAMALMALINILHYIF